MGDQQQLAELEMSWYLQAHHIARETSERTPIPLESWVHPYTPGDEVWVKDWKKEQLQPVWTGPRTVILATPTAVKSYRRDPLDSSHHSQEGSDFLW